MLIHIDIFSCQFINLSIKLVWVVIVGFGLGSYKFYQLLFLCIFGFQSVYVWFISYLFVWDYTGYIYISIVLFCVLSCLAMLV